MAQSAERYWPDLTYYGMALWLDRPIDPDAPENAPLQYDFHLVPYESGPLAGPARLAWEANQARLAVLSHDDEPSLTPFLLLYSLWQEAPDHTPERPHKVWRGSRVPLPEVMRRLFPEVVIRPLDTVSAGPWWRDRSPHRHSQWLWRITEPASSAMEQAPIDYQPASHALWASSLPRALLYGDAVQSVSRAQRREAIPIGREPRHGGLWVWTESDHPPSAEQSQLQPLAMTATTIRERQDAGEKIGGARKDRAGGWDFDQALWAGYGDASATVVIEAARKVTRDTFWPPPTRADQEAFQAAGGHPLVWRWRQALRESLPSTPMGLEYPRTARRYQRGGQQWCDYVVRSAYVFPALITAVRDWATSWRSWEDVVPSFAERSPRTGPFLPHTSAAQRASSMLEHYFKDTQWDLLAQSIPGWSSLPLMDVLLTLQTGRIHHRNNLASNTTHAFIAGHKDEKDILRLFGSWAAAFPDQATQWPKFSWDMEYPTSFFSRYLDLVTPYIQAATQIIPHDILWSLSFPQEDRLHDDLDSSDEGKADEDVTVEEVDPSATLPPKRGLPSPRLTNLTRVGPERRSGPVDEAVVMETFGLRAIEYGNWVKDADRQDMLNRLYDSLADMAEALGVPTRLMGFQGDLAVALGARGRGGHAAAHYEPARRVINLTKTMGAGTLAHEWTHALDHWACRQDDSASLGFASEKSPRDLKNDVAKALQQFAVTIGGAPNAGDAQHRAMLALQQSEVVQQQIQNVVTHFLLTPASKQEHPEARKVLMDWGLRHLIPLFSSDALKRARPSSVLISVFCPSYRDGTAIYSADTVAKNVAKWAEESGHAPLSEDARSTLWEFFYRNTSAYLPDSFGYASFRKLFNSVKGLGNGSAFLQHAKILDGGRSPAYWTTQREMVARAFSAALHDRMATKGVHNDFASAYSAPDQFPLTTFRASPNPEGAERLSFLEASQQVCVAFQQVGQSLRQKRPQEPREESSIAPEEASGPTP